MRARRGSRLRSGRLKVGERRRRIQEAGAKPGEVIILDRHERRRGGERVRGAWQVDLQVQTQFSADIDVRKLVHFVRLALAEHFRASLLAGQRPNGGSLPALKDTEVGRSFGVDTGFLAEHWLLLPVRGGPFAASAVLKPNGEGGRGFMIDRNLRRGIDFQSIDGAAAEVIRRTTEEWLRAAIPSDGDGVATPATVPTSGGTLPQVRRSTR